MSERRVRRGDARPLPPREALERARVAVEDLDRGTARWEADAALAFRGLLDARRWDTRPHPKKRG